MVKLQQAGNTELPELVIEHAGMEQCAPAHAFGPTVREYFLFHYIFAGSGFFLAEGCRYLLQAGQGFMIFPDQVTYYEADRQNPWHYAWIGFRGARAADYVRQAGFSQQAPIYSGLATSPDAQEPADDDPDTPGDYFAQIGRCGFHKGRELKLLGLLCLFLARLAADNRQQLSDENLLCRRDWYVRQAVDFFEMNYARKISITALAAQIGLDRSYFGQLFREATGLAPRQYLLKLRMAKACRLMGHSSLPVAAIAHSVGYDDPLLFSRMFHSVMGCSPTAYRSRRL